MLPRADRHLQEQWVVAAAVGIHNSSNLVATRSSSSSMEVTHSNQGRMGPLAATAVTVDTHSKGTVDIKGTRSSSRVG